jgi:hypothetical protein
MKLKDFNKIDVATKGSRKELFRVGIAVLFIVGVMTYLAANPPPGGTSVLLIAVALRDCGEVFKRI